jgi:antitoxin VapB
MLKYSTKEPGGRSLNIKSAEAHELAAELARLTGESMTKAVTEAIRERLQRERNREKMVAEAMAIARRVATYPRKDRRPHGEFLYDERGLPRR